MSANREHLEELFEPLGGVSIRSMFGGLGIFKEGLMFACVVDDLLRFKADAATAPAFEKEGCGQWKYQSRSREMAMPYWQVPERLLDEPDEFTQWARQAFDVALRTKKGGKAIARARPAAGRASKRTAKKRR